MKAIEKTSYILLGCVLTLSSCRQEEAPMAIPDGADRKIVCHSSLPELTTKAAEIADDLPYFRMSAFNVTDPKWNVGNSLNLYFENEKLEKGASGKYVSDSCVWPEAGRESDLLHFLAFYPQLPDGAALVNNTSSYSGPESINYEIQGYSIAPDIAYQVDFVTAHTTGTMENNYFSGISLSFRHQLCRVEVLAKGVHKSCDIEIAGVALGNVMMKGNYKFQTSDADGIWSDLSKANTEYIFRAGDKVMTVGSDAASIMGSKINNGTYDNCAMLIPADLAAWANTTDVSNTNKGLYLNVLLRVIDATNTPGKGEQRYPYNDNNQGLNSANIPRVVMTVDNDGNITSNPVTLFKDDEGKYYTDAKKTISYSVTVPQGSQVKEFGWAAVPVSGSWEPGKIYTYTLDYTYGVGVHGPEVAGETAPRAGDPIISDQVGVSMSVKSWDKAENSSVTVPGS